VSNRQLPIIETRQKRLSAEHGAEVDALKRLQAETAAKLDALLPALLDRAFKGES
jgi:hypothetical protein